jgi:hypothetical protein
MNAVPDHQDRSSEQRRTELEFARLRTERQKLAMDVRVKRRELSLQPSKTWRDLLANPLTLAIAGGFITLMTQIVTSHITASGNLELEATKAGLAADTERLKADLAEKSARATLQADLIKKFVESPEKDTVRNNLTFLVEANLLPNYAEGITKYLKDHPTEAPQVGGTGSGVILSMRSAPLFDRAVATIAARRLSPAARAKITQLLDGSSLVAVAGWFEQNSRLPQHRAMRELTFVDVPRDAPSVDANRDCKDGLCVIGGIIKYDGILKTQAESKPERAEAVKILLALVSDIHRPLHVAYEDDRGGNLVQIQVNARRISLHALWDEMPFVREPDEVEEFAQEALQSLEESRIASIVNTSVTDWAQEGLQITRQVYARLPQSKSIDAEYIKAGIQVVRLQIIRAGLRLAAILNADLK